MSGKKPIDGRSGVFIDFSNLFRAIGTRNQATGEQVNFNICYVKLREYLEKHHNSPIFYNVYACVDSNPKVEPYITRAANHLKFINWLTGHGYNVLKKDLKHLPGTTKCDTDIEITIDLYKHMNDLDNIILFTGDSDFLKAVQHFQSLGKYIHIYAFKSGISWELKLFSQQNPRCNYTLLDDIRDEIEKT